MNTYILIRTALSLTYVTAENKARFIKFSERPNKLYENYQPRHQSIRDADQPSFPQFEMHWNNIFRHTTMTFPPNDTQMSDLKKQ